MTDSRTFVIAGLRFLAASLSLAIIARATVISSYRVCGASMREALQDGDRILVCDAEWISRRPSVGDTVVAEVEQEVLVKRVAAGPGDLVGMTDGLLVRNGRRVREAIPEELDSQDSFPPVLMGPDEYFLLGDNRRVSVDSREFGPVHGYQLVGRVFLRIHGGGLSTVRALQRPGP